MAGIGRGFTETKQGDISVGKTHRQKVAAGAEVLPAVGWLLAAVTIPMLLHPLGLGPTLLPMHVPVLLAGATLGPLAGMAVGTMAPWISYLLTGMPPVSPPIAPLMVLELLAYGGVAGALRQQFSRARGSVFATYLWLLPSLLAGRIVVGAVAWLIGPSLGLLVPPADYVRDAIATGLPGVVLQLIMVPALIRVIGRFAWLDRLGARNPVGGQAP